MKIKSKVITSLLMVAAALLIDIYVKMGAQKSIINSDSMINVLPVWYFLEFTLAVTSLIVYPWGKVHSSIWSYIYLMLILLWGLFFLIVIA